MRETAEPIQDPIKEFRLPPHSLEAERGILGCIMLNPFECMAECSERFGNDSTIFYDLKHRIIFDSFVAMTEAGQSIELLTLVQWLRDRSQLEAIGGLLYLSTLSDGIVSPMLPDYIAIAFDKQMRRNVIRFGMDIVKISEELLSASEIIDMIECRSLSFRKQDVKGFSNIKTVQQKIVEQAQDAHDGKPIIGFTTGLHNLDHRIGVIELQTVIMLSGMPSAGKTSLAVNICNSILHDQGAHVGVFSMETSDIRFVRRMMCADSKLSARRLKDGEMSEADFKKLTMANGKLSRARDRLHIYDQGGLTVAQLRAKARRMHQLGTRFFVIDYLQLLSGGKKFGNRTEELDYISKQIKDMAKELDCVILAIASESRDGGIRGSAQFDYDADAKWRLECESKDLTREVTLNITKDKESGYGEVELMFIADCMRFESKARIEPEEGRRSANDR